MMDQTLDIRALDNRADVQAALNRISGEHGEHKDAKDNAAKGANSAFNRFVETVFIAKSNGVDVSPLFFKSGYGKDYVPPFKGWKKAHSMAAMPMKFDMASDRHAADIDAPTDKKGETVLPFVDGETSITRMSRGNVASMLYAAIENENVVNWRRVYDQINAAFKDVENADAAKADDARQKIEAALENGATSPVPGASPEDLANAWIEGGGLAVQVDDLIQNGARVIESQENAQIMDTARETVLDQIHNIDDPHVLQEMMDAIADRQRKLETRKAA